MLSYSDHRCLISYYLLQFLPFFSLIHNAVFQLMILVRTIENSFTASFTEPFILSSTKFCIQIVYLCFCD